MSCSAQKQEKIMEDTNKPKVYIGYYLKTLDNLLTQKMDSLHLSNGMTRAEWQILNSVAERPNIDQDTLLNTLKEFTNYLKAKNLLDNLIANGFIQGSQKLCLTMKGQAVYEKSLKMQKEFRQDVMQGISQEDYQNVINTLDKMIMNLKD
jgi:DNA-binding MarR family transcriptional regulator